MPPDISEEIRDFYDGYDESVRFNRNIGPLEWERTKEILLHHLPKSPATILDIGGGPGAHAFWLAELGHRVHLLDLSPKHIELAHQRMADPHSPKLAALKVADARKLDYLGGFADAVFLHGPLYHLIERQDRATALREVYRVLRSGGDLFAVGITKPASLLVGLTRDWIWDDAYLQMVAKELATGQHRRPASWPNLFMNAHFHDVADLRQEISEAGFDTKKIIGIQGPGWINPNFESNWNDPNRREKILQIARLAEDEPMLSPHVMAIAKKSIR